MEQRQAARDAGVNDFLSKPVDLNELVRVLQRWTASRRPDIPLPTGVDVVALNVIFLAAVQHLALAAATRDRFAGVTLDDVGWTRIEAAIDRLLDAYPA
jgi:DNA-binding response OmpR family regulator